MAPAGRTYKGRARILPPKVPGALTRALGAASLWIAGAAILVQAQTTYYWNRNATLTGDRDFSRAYNWTTAQDGTGTLIPSDKDDAFTNDALGSAWTWRDNDNDAGTGSYSLTTNADQLTLSGRGADMWGATNQYVAIYRGDVAGNFDVSVKINSLSGGDATYGKAGIILADDITNFGSGGMATIEWRRDGQFENLTDTTGTVGEFEWGDWGAVDNTGPIWLRMVRLGKTIYVYHRSATTDGWTLLSTRNPLNGDFKGHIGLFVSARSTTSTITAVFDDWTGGGVVSATGMNLSMNGTGANADASAVLGGGDLSANSLDLTGYTGTLSFGGQNGLLATHWDNIDFTGTTFSRVDTTVNMDWGNPGSPDASIGADTWTSEWVGYVQPRYSETYTFYTESDDGARLWVNNTLLVDKWQNQGTTEWSGTIALTAGQTYPIRMQYFENGGGAIARLKWSSASQTKEVIPKRSLFAGKLTLTGTGTVLNMPSGTVTAADGQIEFTAGSGTQTLVPRSGQTLPRILHSGAGTLQLSTNDLTTIGFAQGAGTLDLNGRNITTTASGTNRGDFQIWNGNSSSLSNLGGRTLTVAGNASFTGASTSSYLNLDPGSAWTLAVTGQLTARVASIANCNASVSAGTAYRSSAGSGNSNWTVNGYTFYWDRNQILSGQSEFSRASNWAYGADGNGIRPMSAADDWFDSLSLSSAWTFRDQDGDESYGSYKQTGGQIIISGEGGDIWGATNEYNILYRSDITGDFDVQVKLVSVATTGGTGYKIGMMMADDFTSLSSGGYVKLNYHGTGKFEFSRDQSGNAGEIESNTDGGSGLTLPIIMRLIKNGTSVSAFYKTSDNTGWYQVGSAQTPQSTAANSQIGLFVCAGSGVATAVFDQFQGGSNVSGDFSANFGGSGANADANATLNASQTLTGLDFTGYTGTLDFGSSTLTLASGNATFVSGMGVTANAGTLAFTGTSGTQTFTPKSGATFPAIAKSGAGQVTVATNALTAGAFALSGGTWDWGASTLTHSIASMSSTGSSTMTFGTNTVQITTGDAWTTGINTLNVNSGTLAFTASSGTQTFTPRSGYTHPNLTHTGAGTLKLATNDLICLSFSQSAGIFDFNGKNITTTSSGNFSITNGTTTSIANLGGRTLTVAGATSLSGQNGNLLNLDATSAWTVASTGALTANYATLGRSTASISLGAATNSVNAGGNFNWNMGATDFSAWRYSRRLFFNTTSTGANVSGNVTDFPLLIRLTGTNFDFSLARSDGRDLRFGDPDGTNLPYEIERWDATGKVAEIWVEVPQVDGASTKDFITMYWGNNSASAVSSGAGAFPTASGFQGVWHLNNQFNDATANANNGTNNGTTSASGIIGLAQDFNGTSQYITIPDHTSLNPTSGITVSAWIRSRTWDGGNRRIVQKNTSDNQYILKDENNELEFYSNTTGDDYSRATLPSTGDWHHVVGTFGGSGRVIYVDGVAVSTEAFSASLNTNSGSVDIGRKPGAGDYFSGLIDEVRIENVARSADWIKLSFATQKANAAVLTHEGADLSTWSYSTKVYVNTTASGANITTNQSNYPLLVRLTPANFSFTQALSDGADLRFSDSAGNFLSYEIERWDASSKRGDVWVLLPTVFANNSSQWFRMHWGKTQAASQSSGSAVFLGEAGYAAVWHLGEDGNTSASGYRDATGHGNHGTGINLTNASDVSGNTGLATNFATASNQGISAAHSASLNFSSGLTVEAWANPTSLDVYKRILNKPYTSAMSPWNEFSLETDGSATKVSFSLTIGGTEAGYLSTSTFSLGTWSYVVGTYDGANQNLYFNGSLESSTARSGSISNYSQAAVIGKYGIDANSNWNGAIDEVRFSRVARSDDWIRLCYENMKANSTVVTVGHKSIDYTKSVQLNFNTTAGGANVSGNVANIPLLIRLSSSNFDFTAVRDDGADLQFVDKSGQYLYHETVEWDKGNKTGKVWVKVPQVDGNSTADFITLYYGCATCSGAPYAVSDSVWNGYTSVFHLAGGETQAADAAPLRNHATYQSSTPLSAGHLSPLAPFFEGSGNSHVAVPNESNYDYTTTLSVSAWVKVASFPGTWSPIVNHGNGGWRLHRYGSTNGAAFAITVGGGQEASGTASINDGGWHHVVGTYDGANVKVYVDGAVGSTAPAYTGSAALNNDEVWVGRNSTATTSYWNGNIQDVRLSGNSAVLSADFIKLSYENQKSGSTLIGSGGITAASFTSSKVFKFNTTASGANIAGDVYDFPLLLRLSGSTVLDAVQSGAPDIRFLDGDGVTWLPYSIERWDQSVDSAEVWVRVPKIDGNSSGDFITMYYNDVANGAIPDGQCGGCVFDTAAGISAVWHLNEDGNNNAGGYLDAATGGRHGTGTSMAVGTSDVSGVIGKAQNFDGSADYISIAHNSLFSLHDKGFTLETWVYNEDAGGEWRGIFTKDRDAADWIGLWRTNDATGKWSVANWENSFNSAANAAVNSWQHLAMTSTRPGKLILYVNGTATDSMQTLLIPQSYTNSVHLGRAGGVSEFFDGRIDEARWHRTVRDANWIKLQYQTTRPDAAPLFNPSPVEFNSTRKYTFNTTRTGANVMGDVENFPLLVRITGSTLVDAVQNDYDDIRFLDGDGKTWLQYQVERWDKTVDSAEVWVLVPKVDGNSNTDFITLYYDDVSNGAVSNGECGSCVFTSTNGYKAVWHLNNGVFSDASGGGNTLTNYGSTNAGTVIAGGRTLDGVNDSLTVGTGPSLSGTTDLTLSAWIKTGATSLATLLSQRDAAAYQGEYLFDITAVGTVNFGIYNGGWQFDFATAATVNNNAWRQITAVRSGDNGYIYIDGNLSASASGAVKSLVSSLKTYVGFDGRDANHFFQGSLDEVTISSSARSADFIKLNYETQRQTGNLFWNNRPGPNNKVTLTANPGSGAISLSWTTPVSDSSNADSIGIWVKYSGTVDSVGATGQTKVVILPKTDSSYSYPATYPMTYIFGLAVRNAAGQWSPFTATSTDTVMQIGNSALVDTIYVDSAIGSDANSCASARSPATPKLTIEGADDCDDGSAADTLVIRVMPGTYSGTSNNELDSNSDPVLVASFDINSRAVFNSSSNPTLYLWGGTHLRNLDFKAGVSSGSGIATPTNEGNYTVEGCRIYNSASFQYANGIYVPGTGSNDIHIASNVIHQPTAYGIRIARDDEFNIVNNTLIGTGASNARGIYVETAAFTATSTIANNILYNWDYGIQTVSSTAATGVVANNLFHMVTTGRELTNCTDAGKVIRDPLFYGTNIGERHAFKLLPGSPAIDAGTGSQGGGFSRAVAADAFGNTRPLGAAPDIGAYEGTGFTTGPAVEFDTLTNTVSGNTVLVKNGKWKLVWDMARGSGITGFYDMTVDSTVNLVGTGSLLFDVKLDAFAASGATGNTLAPQFDQRTRARSVVKQRLAVSSSLDLVVWYTVYASGHIFIQSEIVNLSAGTVSNLAVGYSAKVGAATAVALSGGSTSGVNFKNGHALVTTATRDVLLSVSQDLDLGAAGASETWFQAGSAAGSLDSAWMGTSDLADLAAGMRRQHHFLLYVGDGSLTSGKAATLAADAYSPSPVEMSAGSLNHERSWQSQLTGHWTFDDGSGSTAKDKSLVNANDASLTSTAWIGGKVKGALRFTTSSVASVADHEAFEAAQYRTFMLWVKPDFAAMGTDAYLLSKGLGASDGWHFRRVTSASQIKFTMAGTVLTSPVLATGTWNHLAAVVDGSRNLRLYVNGVLSAASSSAATAVANANALRIGENGGTAGVDRFAGDIDDVRAYWTAVSASDIQAIYRQGFSEQYGHYHLRADNNNRVTALLNGGAAATRMQPAFRIDNWYGTKTPKYVYLNGARLVPNVDFVSDSISPDPAFGSQLLVQVNKVLTGADQTFFLDDDDSTGYLGTVGKVKGLVISATANDKIAIKNFSDTVFSSATSGQWYTEIDLNGWTTPTGSSIAIGFGDINDWRAAAIDPSIAISSATNLVGFDYSLGRSLTPMLLDQTVSTNYMRSSGKGFASPANFTYTITDSSSTRLSLVLSNISVTGDGSLTLAKRWTVYPFGRIVGSFTISSISASFNMDDPRLGFMGRYSNGAVTRTWATATATSTGRFGAMGGNLDFHSFAGAILSVKNATSTYGSPASYIGSPSSISNYVGGQEDYFRTWLDLNPTLFTQANGPITVNFFLDFSRDFTDSATADSLAKDLQTPAAITALSSGTANPSDALDFNPTPDGFAEGDGAYVYTAASGTAHFKFVNTVTHFSPAFRIKSWTYSTPPEFVIVDNQTLVKDYQYNVHVNFAANELILQFNKTFAPGTHLFYISHKTGLAVKLSAFEAIAGDGVDSLKWTTESEFENLGFHVWRRAAAVPDLPDSLAADAAPIAGAGIANAILAAARERAAKAAAADTALDTLAEHHLSESDLKALGYVRVSAKLIPGAKGGASASTQNYLFVDRTADFNTTYEYLLESVDFQGTRAQYGPRKARPRNPLETALGSNYPNPFNPVTTLRFSIKEKAKVSLVVYDTKGRVVRTLIRPEKALLAGKYRIPWDARDDRGLEVPTGQYYYRFRALNYVKTRKMLLVK